MQLKRSMIDSTEDDDFEIIGDDLPLRPASTNAGRASPQAVGVDLHPVPEQNSLLVSVVPPAKPENEIPHVPCDVVLVVDVSASMGTHAPVPAEDGSGRTEESGLSVLDLTKHAARTIIETLNGSDRLGVVVFSSEAEVVYNLAPMTNENKAAVLGEIEALQPILMTNLWHGLKKGLRLLSDASPVPENVQSLFVLTDGMPNHMCPQQGYVPKLRPILQEHHRRFNKLPLINTFGFGYSIRSGLLESISELSNGNFAFIPEAGMLGTVFIHAIANLYSTYATQATLTIRSLDRVEISVSDGFSTSVQFDETPSSSNQISVNLKNLHYGQSREILLQYKTTSACRQDIEATLTYNCRGQLKKAAPRTANLSQRTSLPSSVFDYHQSRSRICELLRSFFKQKPDGEHYAFGKQPDMEHFRKRLEDLITDLEKAGHKDEQNASVLQDLAGEPPHGQVRLALSIWKYYDRWGRHYLLSLLNAHAHQICNSFKDPGPLQYGKNSAFFCRCRQELDDYFDELPPPKPSRLDPMHGTHNPHGTHNLHGPVFAANGGLSQLAPAGSAITSPIKSVNMKRFRMVGSACFAGHCAVRLGDKNDSIAVRDVRPGMALWTPRGPRSVQAVVATTVREAALCKLGSLFITPWHPVMAGGNWTYPCEVSHETVPFSGTIYSVLLERSSSRDAHAISVGGHVCVTLGHGVTAANDDNHDARAHEFFGSYTRVVRSLSVLPRDARGVLRARGIKRHPQTGLACSFIGAGQRMRPRLACQHRALGPRMKGGRLWVGNPDVASPNNLVLAP